ncbi:thioredoxin family protein [Alloprevotella tannerae]|uniref:protein-disulfide reductase DsbD family protein n=1 Tax=Alloprevotella tannerae TaxID=76122 RepID=UPI001EDBCEF5|nr:cytochrome c biogenesis protein CcdA [Alloprevotella tannerae]MCG2649039.1 thioredoxin family protein [Alloprevotella tannerae]
MKKFFTLLTLVLLVATAAKAQVNFSVSYKRVNPTEVDVIFKATIAKGWHVYSTNIGEGGPTRASFGVDKADGAEPIGKLKPGPGVKNVQDEIFDMPVSYFENTCTFTQRVKLTKQDYQLKAYLKYGACNDQNCLPPMTVECKVAGKDGPTGAAADAAQAVADKEGQPKDTAAAAPAVTEENAEGAPAAAVDVPQADSATVAKWYTPVIDQLQKYGNASSTAGRSLFYIFLMGILGGIVTLFTPCVWPIIPMTVSFFLHRSDDRRKAVREAIIYGISIVVIYVTLGLVISGLFGASALNSLSTNAVFNIIFCLMLLIFGASFLGGFEITLPSKWNNAVDSKASSTAGLLGIFLMAFTLTLVSFSCTAPIVGFLLVEASTSTGSAMAPAVGMVGFALALALPFTLFALFPTMMKKAPKSGSWMNMIKVVLGFVEIAFALKFLSVADLAYGWHILDREVFLSLWIILFAALGCYLFGWLRFPHDDVEDHTGVTRFFMGVISFAFAVYMVPGLWGAPCKAVSAFSPPISTQDFNLDPVKVEAKFRDYDAGMAYAKSVNKPVLLDFTGHGCVNCRKMELAVWHDPKVRDLLMKDYVLISLYVDEKAPLPENVEVQEDGKTTTLRTVGDKWSYLQRHKFGSNQQPLYVPVDNEGNPLNHTFSYKEDIDGYVKFLKEGIDRYKAK